MNLILSQLQEKAKRLGLITLIYNLNNPIVNRFKKSTYSKNFWQPIEFLGLEMGTVIFSEKIFIIGTNNKVSKVKLEYIKNLLFPYIELTQKNFENMNIIHDLKTPLLCMRNQLFLDPYDLNEIKSSLEFVINFSERIINSSTDGKYTFQYLINKTVKLYSGLKSNLKFNVVVPEIDIYVQNSTDLYRILNNLLSNIFRYADEETVLINLTTKKDKWMLKMENSISSNKCKDSFGMGAEIISELAIKNKIRYSATVKNNVWISLLEGEMI